MRVSEILLGLGSMPADIGVTTSRLFEQIDEDPADLERRDMLEGYFREVSRMVLDWMATSEEGALREVQERIRNCLRALPPTHPANRALPDGEWLGIRLRGLSAVISTYLSTTNLAHSLGAISGVRRHSWQRALTWMAESSNRTVRATDLVGTKLFDRENTASHALNRMAALGLVSKTLRDGAATFTLTWSGESAARVLAARGSQEQTSDNPPSDKSHDRAKPAPEGIPNETKRGAPVSAGVLSPYRYREAVA